MHNAKFWRGKIHRLKRLFNLDFLDLELEVKSQTCVIIENDSVEETDIKTLSAQVVERILTDLLTKIPIKDEFSGNMKKKSSEGMHN